MEFLDMFILTILVDVGGADTSGGKLKFHDISMIRTSVSILHQASVFSYSINAL